MEVSMQLIPRVEKLACCLRSEETDGGCGYKHKEGDQAGTCRRQCPVEDVGHVTYYTGGDGNVGNNQ